MNRRQDGAVLTYVIIAVAVFIVIAVAARLMYHASPTSSKTNIPPEQSMQSSPTPSVSDGPVVSGKYNTAQAETLVQQLWGGYNSGTSTRQDIINNSNASVQSYINSDIDYDPISCSPNNLYENLSYSQAQVSGTTATIDVTEEPGLVVDVSVDLNSLQISNIYCPPENPHPTPPF